MMQVKKITIYPNNLYEYMTAHKNTFNAKFKLMLFKK